MSKKGVYIPPTQGLVSTSPRRWEAAEATETDPAQTQNRGEDSYKANLCIFSHTLSKHGSAGKESTCNVGDLGLIPELGRSPGEGKGYPLLYSGLENSMDCIVSMGSQRIGHDWVTFTSLHFIQASSTVPLGPHSLRVAPQCGPTDYRLILQS